MLTWESKVYVETAKLPCCQHFDGGEFLQHDSPRVFQASNRCSSAEQRLRERVEKSYIHPTRVAALKRNLASIWAADPQVSWITTETFVDSFTLYDSSMYWILSDIMAVDDLVYYKVSMSWTMLPSDRSDFHRIFFLLGDNTIFDFMDIYHIQVYQNTPIRIIIFDASINATIHPVHRLEGCGQDWSYTRQNTFYEHDYLPTRPLYHHMYHL